MQPRQVAATFRLSLSTAEGSPGGAAGFSRQGW